MIKIAYIIDSIDTPAAGTEKQLLLLLHGLDRSRFTPYLICLRDSEWLRSQSFPFDLIRFDVRNIASSACIRDLRRFVSLSRKEAFDIVQTFFVDGNIFGAVGARLSGRPVVISSRRSLGRGYNRLNISLLRFLRRWTTRYLANSKAAADWTVEVEKVSAEKVDVIYNGLDLSRFRSISPEMRREQRRKWQIENDETVVGIVANLRDVKNIDSLVRVAARLMKDFPRLRFISVGEGPDRRKLQALIASAGLGDRFLLAGQKTDILPCLAAFDIATLCSTFESFSNSLIEYMAAGLPAVASNVGGNGEAITDGETGLLYPVTEEQELEKALKRLLTNRSLAARMGEYARQSAFDRFSKEVYIRRHEEYYESLMQVARSPEQRTAASLRKR